MLKTTTAVMVAAAAAAVTVLSAPTGSTRAYTHQLRLVSNS